MYAQQPPTRHIPGILSYVDSFSTKKSAYVLFFCLPGIISILSFILNSLLTNIWNFFYLTNVLITIYSTSGGGAIISILFFSKKSPLLDLPPKGWALQMNSLFTGVMGLSLLIGQTITIFLRNAAFQEVFLILGTIISFILTYVVYFSFTTVGKYGNFILAFAQPAIEITFYSIFASQLPFLFFIRAMIFFTVCAFIFAIPYARSLSRVSNIYRQATGIGGYPFIRAFVLSMLTEGHNELLESFFDKIGVYSDVKIQYLAIRSEKTKKLKGLFVIPQVHFGPFKTCGSSDLPAHIYDQFKDIEGTTVYHTTNDHAQNLTSQKELEKILSKIKSDVKHIQEGSKIEWIKGVNTTTRSMANSAKLLGIDINNVAIVFLTRHPLPSDDIQMEVGEEIRKIAKAKGYREIIIIDSHNSIIGDEVLIRNRSLEANDLIAVSEKFLDSNKKSDLSNKIVVKYGVAKDLMLEYSEKDGIGTGGLVVHLFKDIESNQKTVFIHFDANNAYVDIRSFVLNMLQNRGIERGEITTSDSHTVARQFSQRGYSPIGDKITLETILEKIDTLLAEAENNLDDVEFSYYDSNVENVKIWGNPKYFDVIMTTLFKCIKVSQGLFTYSLIIPALFSIILLIFFYNITFSAIL
jgi:predicted neutral ceramidase superfamily lipid hydrolase